MRGEIVVARGARGATVVVAPSAIEAALLQMFDRCGLAREWGEVLAIAVRAVRALTTQLSREVVQRVVTDSVAHDGYLEAAEVVAARLGLAYSEADPPRGTQQFFLGAAHYGDATLNAFQAAGARVRQLWERVESTVTPPRAGAVALARQDTVPLVDDRADVVDTADAVRSEAAATETAVERAAIRRQQDAAYAVAEAADRARQDREASERAATSQPPVQGAVSFPAIGGEPSSCSPPRAPMPPQPAEEVDLDAVRRARIVRFQGGGGS